MAKRRLILSWVGVALALVASFPSLATAQAIAGSIAGVVKDSSGAVLPGVTVEASSPALIEKVRTVVSNDQGLYQIVSLPPGVYAVTFTLTGFNTFRREGVELSVGFTANINADLSVGALEETVTVSGQAPLVDVNTTARQQTFTRQTIDNLPVARNYQALAVLIPGMVVSGAATTASTQDVGGNVGDRNVSLVYHGSAAGDMPNLTDGIKLSNSGGGGGANAWLANNGILEEIVFDTSGFTAETAESGVRINHITKQGGNMFSGVLFGSYTNDHFQADNVDDAQKALGLSKYLAKKIWDFNPSVGGPIKRDRLWFYYSYRNWGAKEQPPGTFFDTDPNDFVYIPDHSRPGISDFWTYANNLRLTWQAASKHKVALYADTQRACTCGRQLTSAFAPEAVNNRTNPMNETYYASWNWTASNRLLIEATEGHRREENDTHAVEVHAADGIQVVDNGKGITFRSLGFDTPAAGNTRYRGLSYLGRASVTYVTGSHNLKVGADWMHLDRKDYARAVSPGINYTYVFTNGVPTSVSYLLPSISYADLKLALGTYVQDQWKVKNLTLNMGVRLDYWNSYIPAQHLVAGYGVGVRDYAELDNLPNWKDLEPRLGMSYDPFGAGRTAIKANVGRFVETPSGGIAGAVNPASSTALIRTTRAWTDNGDFVPQENELGPRTNANYGTIGTAPIRYDNGLTTGWGKRAKNWEWSAGIQQELRTGLSMDAGYFHRTRANFRVTDNLLVTSADYSQFCVTAPVDPKLPGGGGNQICGLYDLNPTRADGTVLFGKSDNVIKLDSAFGKQTEIFDGIDVSVTARLAHGVRLQGGTSTGRVKTSNCYVIDSPGVLRFCDIRPPFQTQAKVLAIYPLPWWGLQTSATFQTIPGPQITAAWAAPAAAVTGLGRPLAGNAKTVTVPLVQPGTQYSDRFNQMDLRVTKEVRVQKVSVQGQFDLYNLFNSNATTSLNTTYGTSWQTPTVILAGRLLKFGVLLKF